MLALVQDGSLQHVTSHLCGRDLQSLRTTCRALRHSDAILSTATKLSAEGLDWFNAAIDLPYLRSLPNLSTLSVCFADSLFLLHHLSGLHVRSLGVFDPANGIDLAPLAMLGSLCALELHSEAPFYCLMQLTQLTRVAFCAGSAAPGLDRLPLLRELRACTLKQIAEARVLQQLSHLEIACSSNLDAAQLDAAFGHMRHMPALRTLITHDGSIMPAALQLTQLRTLYLDLDQQDDTFLDLSVDLTALQVLGLGCEGSRSTIVAPSVTCIRLSIYRDGEGNAWLPTMTGCCQLRHIRLCVNEFPLTIDADELPPQHVRIAADVGQGKVFAEVGADKRFTLEMYDHLDHYQLP